MIRNFVNAFTTCTTVFFTLAVLAFVSWAAADQLTLRINNQTIELTGEILIEGQDSSLYFRSHDGKIWFVQPDQVKTKIDDDETIEPISKKELGKQLLAELPDGFKIYETKHYVIAYQNEPVFARWIGGLYDGRLYRGFEQFWERKHKLPLTDPQFPMVAIIFGSKAEYDQHVLRELGADQSMIAYYNLQTNRVTMYDLTAQLGPANSNLSSRRLEQILQTPAAIPMVATIIHEATHQLIFNRGIQTRFAESPLWLNEGLAIFFETPALNSTHGWRVPGLINDQRLLTFRKTLAHRQANALATMIQSDDPFRETETATDNYAAAWAFNHFLLNRHAEPFVQYIKFMSEKKALIEDTPETRLADFKKFMGDDLEKLEQEFIEYVKQLK